MISSGDITEFRASHQEATNMTVSPSVAQMDRTRIVSLIAATLCSLACGSNYAFSAWAPDYALRLELTSTQVNVIALAGNCGMYLLGIPVGMVVDREPRYPVLSGSALLLFGYWYLRKAYVDGGGSMILLVLANFATGFGGCQAFNCSIKTAALNFPKARGAATAGPLAAFGLSAVFWSVLSQLTVGSKTDAFLLILGAGCFFLTFSSFFFLKVVPHSTTGPAYAPLPSGPTTESNPMRRTASQERKLARAARRAAESIPNESIGDETSSLMSSPSGVCSPESTNLVDEAAHDRLSTVQVRGWGLIFTTEFYFLISLMGLLTGTGLLTINNIGSDATALWEPFDVPKNFLQQRQAIHVSVLSVCSFVGRISSGIGSDFIARHFRANRAWCLVLSSFIFIVAQVCALEIENPRLLMIVSSLTGFAYGLLFGVFPSITAETFGVNGMSTNWGVLTLAPVFSSQLFGLVYGRVYDAHSTINDDGELKCYQGRYCYHDAYILTLIASAAGLFISLAFIHLSHRRKRTKAFHGSSDEDHEA